MYKQRPIGLLLIGILTLTQLSAYGRCIDASKETASVPAKTNLDDITSDQLRNYLYFIASDEMEGRDTPSRGLNTVAKFIAMELAHWGFKPAGDNGTFFQTIALQRRKVDVALTYAEFNDTRYEYGKDFVAGSGGIGSATGQLVYVGSGLVIKAKNINSFDGIDVRNKIMIATLGLPQGVTNNDLNGRPGQDYDNAITYALSHGAKGIIYVPQFAFLTGWERITRNNRELGTVSLEKLQTFKPLQIPTMTASPGMLAALFQGERVTAAGIFNRATGNDPVKPFALRPEKTITINVGVVTEPAQTQNIVAVWPGADPALGSEYVALGAHYDHLGIGPPVNGDSIYNGADDDGSGTTALLAIAEAVSHNPQKPKRSMLFVWHCGEEKGLWGSLYFTENPTVPLSHIIAQLNIDMIGRSKKPGETNPKQALLSGPNEIYLLGPKVMCTELGELSDAVNKANLNLSLNYGADDLNEPNHLFFRSDHFNYARKGIPIIFYFDGVHEDYHQPSDSADKIDYQKLEKVTRTIYATAWALAELPQRPKVDKPLPKELSKGLID